MTTTLTTEYEAEYHFDSQRARPSVDTEASFHQNYRIVRVSNADMGVNLDPTDKVFFFADSGSPGGPN